MKALVCRLGMVGIALWEVALGAHLAGRLEGVHERFLDDRRVALPLLSDPYGIPASARVVSERSREAFREGFPWKRNVVATVFWVGELAGEHNPVPNTQSAWDQNWQANFGGVDHPDRRDGWCPEGFTPLLSPFYCALPYNDVIKGGKHRPEASVAVPWFWEDYRGDGISVCKDRWVAIHSAGRVCYAQWEDVGPFEVDHWQYVFGQQAPRINRNQSAGIDLSPAVRDFLSLQSGATVEWRFVDERQVPKGPWLRWTGTPSLPQR
jgi:hypothetical protein